MRLVSLIDYSSFLKNICERNNLFIKMVNLWIHLIVVLSNLAEIVYVNSFYVYMKWQVIMPSPASKVFNLLAFKIIFSGHCWDKMNLTFLTLAHAICLGCEQSKLFSLPFGLAVPEFCDGLAFNQALGELEWKTVMFLTFRIRTNICIELGLCKKNSCSHFKVLKKPEAAEGNRLCFN